MTTNTWNNGPGTYPVREVISTMTERGRLKSTTEDMWPIGRQEATPTCSECHMFGIPVETITDMIVWHHEDPEVENDHDFTPKDGRPTFISGTNVETVGVLVEHLSQVDPETIPVRIQDREGGSLRTIYHVAVHYDPTDEERRTPVLVITGY